MISLKSFARRFRRDQAGSMAVETMLMTPILVWFFIATLQYFDGYRSELIANKAALTIADMYSRETGYIDPNYLNGTQKLLRQLTLTEDNPSFRVTSFFWHERQKRYKVRWSRRRGDLGVLRTSDLAAIANRLPILSDQERALLIETKTAFTPKYGNGFGIMEGTGLTKMDFRTFVITSPRFGSKRTCWNATPDDPTRARC